MSFAFQLQVTASVVSLHDTALGKLPCAFFGFTYSHMRWRVLHQQSFFEKVEPVNFNTIATPHCGLPRYPSIFSSIAQTLGPRMLSRTGEQFYCADKWSPKGRPLLIVMADPSKYMSVVFSVYHWFIFHLDRIFYQALAKFQHIRIYANAYVHLVLNVNKLTDSLSASMTWRCPMLQPRLRLQIPLLTWTRMALICTPYPWNPSQPSAYNSSFMQRIRWKVFLLCPKIHTPWYTSSKTRDKLVPKVFKTFPTTSSTLSPIPFPP